MISLGPLVDTSVLIDYFAGEGTTETDLLDHFLADGPPPATCPIIVQEYLQGLTDPRDFRLARADLENFHQISPPDYSLHLKAADFHIRSKRRGVTVPTVDTLIVTLAWASDCSLLTRDSRQVDLARFLKIALTGQSEA
jgi:predicted nucleic acid-binding protein